MEFDCAFIIEISVFLAVFFNKFGRLDFVFFHKYIGGELEKIEGLLAPLFEEIFFLGQKVVFGCGLSCNFFSFS